MSDPCYLEVSDANAIALLNRNIEGPVSMLNLLRFKSVADYSDHRQLAPASAISGRDAYDRYINHTIPFLTESGGELLYLGTGGSYLIGPEDEGWDLVMLVRQQSIAAFMAFAENTEYLKGIGHRDAALQDSRILPLQDRPAEAANVA